MRRDGAAVVAVRSARPELLEHVQEVVTWFDAEILVRPPGSPPPPADVHIDVPDEGAPGDPPWFPGGGGIAVGTVERPGVLCLPGDAEELADAVAAVLAVAGGRTIGVVGARGGAGTSVVTALLARTAASSGRPCAIVDLAGGLDVLLGIEDEPGPRWGDLGLEAGPYPGARLAAVLPAWGRVRLLTADARGIPAPSLVPSVTAALGEVASVVVCDLGRGEGVLPRCDAVVVVTTAEPTSVAGVARVLGSLRDRAGADRAGANRAGGAGAAGEVDRAGGGLRCSPRVSGRLGHPTGVPEVFLAVRMQPDVPVPAHEVAQACGLPLAVALPHARRLGADLARGVAPGDRRRSGIVRAVRHLALVAGALDASPATARTAVPRRASVGG